MFSDLHFWAMFGLAMLHHAAVFVLARVVLFLLLRWRSQRAWSAEQAWLAEIYVWLGAVVVLAPMLYSLTGAGEGSLAGPETAYFMAGYLVSIAGFRYLTVKEGSVKLCPYGQETVALHYFLGMSLVTIGALVGGQYSGTLLAVVALLNAAAFSWRYFAKRRQRQA